MSITSWCRRSLTVLTALTLGACGGGSTETAVLASGAPVAETASGGDRVELDFTIDRQGLPPPTYPDLTLKVHALGATAAEVRVDGVKVPSRLEDDRVVFTTPGRKVVVSLLGAAEVGSVSPRPSTR